MTAAAPVVEERRFPALGAILRRNGWTLGLIGFLVVLLVFTKLIQPTYGVSGIQGLAIAVLPLALAAAAQAVVVISGGIDLSIGSMMALTSVVAATRMDDQPPEVSIAVVLLVLVIGLVLGAVNGALVVVTRVPDIVVTLAMSFVWAGAALLVLRHARRRIGRVAARARPGLVRQRVDPEGGDRARRDRGGDLDPAPALAPRAGVLRHRQQPAGRVPQRRVGRAGRSSSPTWSPGCSPRSAGLMLLASTGIGTPVPGPYTLLSVAASSSAA